MELHCDISFSITSAKEFKDHIFIFDDTVKLVEDNGVEKPETELDENKVYVYMFYSVEATAVLGEDNEKAYRFLVYARDVDDAKRIIEKSADENDLSLVDAYVAAESVVVNVTSATKVNCSGVIGREFTEAYNKPEEEE